MNRYCVTSWKKIALIFWKMAFAYSNDAVLLLDMNMWCKERCRGGHSDNAYISK
jgi:hypothetical protein